MRKDLPLLFNLRYAIFIEKIRHNLNIVLIVKFHTFKMEIELHRSLICKYRKLKKSIFCDINTNESQKYFPICHWKRVEKWPNMAVLSFFVYVFIQSFFLQVFIQLDIRWLNWRNEVTFDFRYNDSEFFPIILKRIFFCFRTWKCFFFFSKKKKTYLTCVTFKTIIRDV